jgi:hypothetical protein
VPVLVCATSFRAWAERPCRTSPPPPSTPCTPTCWRKDASTAAGCTHVAMEATGAYWKPIHNILEGEFDLLVVNAQHVKAVRGCKTDVRADNAWPGNISSPSRYHSMFRIGAVLQASAVHQRLYARRDAVGVALALQGHVDGQTLPVGRDDPPCEQGVLVDRPRDAVHVVLRQLTLGHIARRRVTVRFSPTVISRGYDPRMGVLASVI